MQIFKLPWFFHYGHRIPQVDYLVTEEDFDHPLDVVVSLGRVHPQGIHGRIRIRAE